MLLDAYTKVGAALALTGSDEVTGSSYDTGNVTPKRRVGDGEALSVVFVVTTAGAGDSGSFNGNFTFAAVEDTAADLSTKTVIIQRDLAGASVTAGAIVEVPLPHGTPTKRYIGGQGILGAGDTATVDCYVLPRKDVPNFVAYAKGYVV
jgi:hypothetical protein